MVHIRLYLLAALTFGMALALLSHFASLWAFGEFLIAEPNTTILLLETVGLVSVLIFGAFCFFEQVRGRPSNR